MDFLGAALGISICLTTLNATTYVLLIHDLLKQVVYYNDFIALSIKLKSPSVAL